MQDSVEGKSEINESRVFPIRAHHLHRYMDFVGSIVDGEVLNMGTGSVVEGVDRDEMRLLLEKEANMFVEKIKKSPDNDYVEDILGSSDEEEEAFKNRYIESLEDFLFGPEDQLVEITEGVDRICRCCVGGAHCESSMKYDRVLMSRLRRRRRELGEMGGGELEDLKGSQMRLGDLRRLMVSGELADLIRG